MMKNTQIFVLMLMASLALSSCGTSYYASTSIEDDIYYRPSKADRENIVEKAEEARKAVMKKYTINDQQGHSYDIETDLSYEQLIRKFDSPSYDFYYDYGVWASPWYNPWWGINRWHSPFYYGGWYSWYMPYSYSYYNPFYYHNYALYGWYDPWYYGYGWFYDGFYDPWYWDYAYYNRGYRPGYGPGPGPNPQHDSINSNSTYYGQRTNRNSGLISPSRQEALRGISASSSSYSNKGVYTGRSNSSRGESATSYTRTNTRSNIFYGNSSSNVNSGYTRSSGSSSSGSFSSGGSGGFSGGSSGGFSGSSSGGNAGGSGSHSGGGRR